MDLRKDKPNSGDYVTHTEGLKMSKKIGTFVECSALTTENLKLLFQEAVRAALEKAKPRKRKCCTLSFCIL